MSKLKEEYIKARNERCNESVIIKSDIYIKELEEQNEEMLECLLEFTRISNEYYGCATDTYIYTRSLATSVVMGVIEKITGKSIEEVLKDE